MESGHAADNNVNDVKYVADNKRHDVADAGYVADSESSSTLVNDMSNLKIGGKSIHYVGHFLQYRLGPSYY